MQSFVTNKKFWALEYFPYGMERSGDFTRSQVDLLKNHGLAYVELNNGVRKPETAQEKEFVEFCQGHKQAENEHEKAWKKFTDVTSHPRGYISLASSQKSKLTLGTDDSSDYEDSDLIYE